MTCDPIEPNIGAWVQCGVARAKRGWLLLYLVEIAIQLPNWPSAFGNWGGVLSNIWSLFGYSILMIGYQLYALRIVRGDADSRPSVVLGGFRRYFAVFGAFIGYVIMVMIGLILLIVPGILIFIRYLFAPLAIIAEGVGIRAAFAWSAEITHGYKLKLLFLYLGWGVLYWGVAVLLGIIATGFNWPTSLDPTRIWWVPLVVEILVIPWYTAVIAAAYASLSARAKQGGSRPGLKISSPSLDTPAE